jgi:twitching motility two-component system response regulator PilH
MSVVLIIEDSPTDAHVYQKALEASGHRVLLAPNADVGVPMAEMENPDVILMDIVMPGMNGFQATRQLHKQPSTRHIPIIMLSTKSQETDRIWALRQGATDYLVKPVPKPVLLDAVKAALVVA